MMSRMGTITARMMPNVIPAERDSYSWWPVTSHTFNIDLWSNLFISMFLDSSSKVKTSLHILFILF
jgi:hypothetical protein